MPRTEHVPPAHANAPDLLTDEEWTELFAIAGPELEAYNWDDDDLWVDDFDVRYLGSDEANDCGLLPGDPDLLGGVPW